MLAECHTEEMITVLTRALGLTPEQANTAREAIAVA